MTYSEHDETEVARILAAYGMTLASTAAALPGTVNDLDETHREEIAAIALWIGDHIQRLTTIVAAAQTRHRPAPIPCGNRHGCPDDADANKAGRCSACYQYQRRTGADRTTSGAR